MIYPVRLVPFIFAAILIDFAITFINSGNVLFKLVLEMRFIQLDRTKVNYQEARISTIVRNVSFYVKIAYLSFFITLLKRSCAALIPVYVRANENRPHDSAQIFFSDRFNVSIPSVF